MTMHLTQRHKHLRLYWIAVVAFLLVVGIQGLVSPSIRTPRCSAQPRSLVLSPWNHRLPGSVVITAKGQSDDPPPKVQVVDYNDDAFGLVFLCGAFVAKDLVFSATFLIGSGVAALLTKQGKVSFSNQIPPIVAVCSLLLASLFSLFLENSSWITLKSESAWQVESFICFLSILYGFVLSPLITRQR